MKNGPLTEMEFPRMEVERRPRKASLPAHDISAEIHEEKMEEEEHDEPQETIATDSTASDLFDSSESLENEADKRIGINLGDYFAGIQPQIIREAKTVFMPKIFWYSK